MPKQQSEQSKISQKDNSLKNEAEQLVCENWLNTYSRETGQFDTLLNRTTKNRIPIDIERLVEELARNKISLNSPACIHFFNQALCVVSPLKKFSSGGYHQHEGRYFIYNERSSVISALKRPEDLADMITKEMGYLYPGQSEEEQQQRQTALYQRMVNSLDNTRQFFNKQPVNNPEELQQAPSTMITAEQQMKLGHPFHVLSKASTGFDDDDLQIYAPENGASFQLHFFAVEPTLLEEQQLTESTLIHDREVFKDAYQKFPEAYRHYKVLPVHPWQAKYLLSQSEIDELRQQNLLLPVGACGCHVWPTSSVRTVWVPDDRYFLKLPLNVRITNFLRNNPLEHGQRALDVSRALHALPLSLWRSQHFYVVLEEGYQLLKTHNEALQAATLVIQRQSLCDSHSDNAQVLSALLEPQSGGEELPLYHLLRSAASYRGEILDSNFIDRWWQQYLCISFLPLLRLFTDAGISLEGHLQNSLLACEHGWPQRFYIRDMEGASIDQERYFSRGDACLDTNSPALYTGAEAWFRFKYYVLVNHINHFIACLARTGLINESHLWSLLDRLLDEITTSSAQLWIEDLRSAATLPSKLNMLSCYGQHGETPSWSEIPNPLYQAHTRLRIESEIRKHGVVESTQLPRSQAYIQAQRRVIRQTLEALLYEKVIAPCSWVDDCIVLSASSRNRQEEDVIYRCQAVVTESFERVRLLSDEVIRVSSSEGNCIETTVTSIDAMLNEITVEIEVDPNRWQGFIQELLHTTLKHGQSLLHKNFQLLSEANSDRLEARLSDGHPYHPTFKSRIGFSVEDNQRFSPELSDGFSPILLAARKTLCHVSIIDTLSVEELIHREGLSHWAAVLNEQGLCADDYLPLPVHPWQWREVILPLYQSSMDRKDLIPIGLMDDHYLPQQSIRTISNTTRPHHYYLKLAMSLLNTSTKRLLPPHTIANAAPISAWLGKIVDQDQQLPAEHKPLLLKEVAAIGFSPVYAQKEQYGALACIWRESHRQVNDDPQLAIIPLQVLMTLDIDGRPFIDGWISQHGLHHWLKALIKQVYIPVLHLLWAHGVALESHAQNMAIAHSDGLPQRAVLKDFHDGVRFNRQWLSDPSLINLLIEAPEEHRRINPNSYLEEENLQDLRDFVYDALFFVNLAELAWLLSQYYELKETQFWEIVSNEILTYQAAHLSLVERFSLFDIFAEEVSIEKLASRRFTDSRSIYMRVKNPLYKARQRLQANTRLREVHLCE